MVLSRERPARRRAPRHIGWPVRWKPDPGAREASRRPSRWRRGGDVARDSERRVRMEAPLSDVRVIEVTNFVAAPSAGAVLADFGADVVKVEPLRGDTWRGMTRPPKVPDRHARLSTTASRWTTGASDRWPSPSTAPRAPTWCGGWSPGRRLPVQPAPAPPAALRPRLAHPAGRQPAAGARDVHRLRHDRARRAPPRLRRHGLLRPRSGWPRR